MYILKRISGFILLATILWDCDTKSTQEAKEKTPEEFTSGQKKAICLGNNVSVRDAPATTGDRLTAIAIGESVAYLDSVVVDTESKGNFEYALIRLSDDTEGWAVKSYLFVETQLLAITKVATIYSRPDLLTGTKKSFQPMDLVVLTSGEGSEEAQMGDWLPVTGKVRGAKSFTSGWIKAGNATADSPDVLVAQLVYKANELKDTKRINELNSIISDEAYSNSIFINDIRVMTYNDPNGFLKKEHEKYYVGMINYYDSAGHDYYYGFSDEGSSVDVFGKTFYSYRISRNCDYCEYYYPWYLFYDFITSVASHGDYEMMGYYGNDFEFDDKMTAIEELAGEKVYKGTTDDGFDFNYVNPAFVSWVSNNLIPHPDNDFLGMSAQKVYDVVFRGNAQDIWSQHRALAYHFDMDELVASYEDGMSYDDFQGYEYLKSRFRGTGINPILAGIFIRRKIDGSYDEVTNAMQKVMTIYDGEWMAEQLENEPYIEEYYEEEEIEEGE